MNERKKKNQSKKIKKKKKTRGKRQCVEKQPSHNRAWGELMWKLISFHFETRRKQFNSSHTPHQINPTEQRKKQKFTTEGIEQRWAKNLKECECSKKSSEQKKRHIFSCSRSLSPSFYLFIALSIALKLCSRTRTEFLIHSTVLFCLFIFIELRCCLFSFSLPFSPSLFKYCVWDFGLHTNHNQLLICLCTIQSQHSVIAKWLLFKFHCRFSVYIFFNRIWVMLWLTYPCMSLFRGMIGSNRAWLTW